MKTQRTKRKNQKRRIGNILLLSMFLLTMTGYPVYATGAGGGFSGVTNALTVLKTGLFAIIAGVGVIILGKNIMEAATAFQQQDSAGLNNAIKGIIAGGLMAAVGTIVTAMGF